MQEVSEPQQLALQMQHAEERGDRRAARALAREILAANTSDAGSSDADVSATPEAGARLSAEQLLQRTQPDAFLLVVGLLGLGLMVWLVYNYVL